MKTRDNHVLRHYSSLIKKQGLSAIVISKIYRYVEKHKHRRDQLRCANF